MTKKTIKSAQNSGSSSASAKAKVVRPAAFQAAQDLNKLLLTGSTNEAMETMMTKGKKQFEKLSQDANDFGRDGIEAFVKSSTIFAKGFEDLFRTSMALAQSSAEKQSQYIKEAMSSKTLNEFTEVQSKIAQANFDDFMASATKISEMSVKLLTEASEPLNAQATKTMQKASDLAA